jgi:CDP-6-deoxy-D-xylo-4-hexulose-3-dehydrase
MKYKEKKFLEKILLEKRKTVRDKKNYPLTLENPIDVDDLIKGIEVILNGQITMSEITKNFENEFSKFIGSKYALMVNSGSSANLLAFFSIINPLQKNRVKFGSECIIPGLCWSTSLWPIVQTNLKPIFVDIDFNTFNLSIDKLVEKISKDTKVVCAVHILGNSTNMSELSKIIKEKDLILIEDSCESLGSKFNNKYLGTFGKFGTYSFFISHQITSGEGGMLVCDNFEDYKIAHQLRAHGWDRGFENNKNNKFNFVNSGFNLRPTDINAAIGYSQFKKLNKFKKIRNDNKKKIINFLTKSKSWDNQFTFLQSNDKVEPSWFGFPIVLRDDLVNKKEKFLKKLNKNGIETRPIISGNFLNQPSISLYNLNSNNQKLVNCQKLEDRGFFIGLHTEPITKDRLNFLTKQLLEI